MTQSDKSDSPAELNVTAVDERYVGDRHRNKCHQCGGPMEPARRHRGGGSRPRIYCSNACRQAAYRDRVWAARWKVE